jgi:hypothetical protein
MNTTIFLPMPEWQALAFLRNREKAFQRLLTPDSQHFACEVMLFEDSLFGFKQRKDAVELGHRVYPHGFAIVRFNVMGKVLNGLMTLQRQVVGVTDPQHGTALWRVSRDGVDTLRSRSQSGEVEILVDEIFGSGESDLNVDRCATTHERPDNGLLEEGGGRPAFYGGTGPTGFGC